MKRYNTYVLTIVNRTIGGNGDYTGVCFPYPWKAGTPIKVVYLGDYGEFYLFLRKGFSGSYRFTVDKVEVRNGGIKIKAPRLSRGAAT